VSVSGAIGPSPWREPAEETVGLYPGLVVHDARKTGSITAGSSRLPLWAFAGVAITHGWDEAEDGWSPSDYGVGRYELARFIVDLLEMRGEFARLLLVLANAERAETERADRYFVELGSPDGVNDITPGTELGDNMPPAWWADPDLARPVLDQLERCLACLRGVVD